MSARTSASERARRADALRAELRRLLAARKHADARAVALAQAATCAASPRERSKLEAKATLARLVVADLQSAIRDVRRLWRQTVTDLAVKPPQSAIENSV